MTPDENGRFCNSCQKTVTDFSKFSDEQLLAFFAKKEKTENVCGKVRHDQLNRSVFISKPVPNYYNRWLALAMGFFTMIKTSASQTENKKDESGIVIQNKEPQLQISNTSSSAISGIVLDAETKEPVRAAFILIAGTETGTMTDAEGRFEFDEDLAEEKTKLIIKYQGYKTNEIELIRGKNLQVITLMREGLKLDEVVISDYQAALIDPVTTMGAMSVLQTDDLPKLRRVSKARSFFYKIFHFRKWKEVKKRTRDEGK